MDYQEAISFIQSYPDSERGSAFIPPGRNLKMLLSTMQSFLQVVGNPQNCAKTIHITGSKGKGSTATFITNILNKAGFKTALFTSPHIHSYTERFAFNLEPISESLFAQGITELKPYIEEFDRKGFTFSTFGILTTLFFYLVNKAGSAIDWQIVEVGLGGKDDLTNIFEKKEAAVITPISLEHTAILGETRKAIAENKAGIITRGCITVLAKQNDKEVEEVIKNICQQKQSIFIASTDFIASTEIEMSCPIKLFGDHQKDNAGTAINLAYALRDKGYKISDEAIKEGLASAHLPGRFEIIEPNRIEAEESGHTELVGKGNKLSFKSTVVLDGAHNGDSANALANTLKQIFPHKPIVFIIGVNQDKNIEDIFNAIKNQLGKSTNHLSKIIATKSDNYRAMSAEEIRKRILACQSNVQIICTKNIDEALEKAKEIITDGEILCICGSFYLVAEARERLATRLGRGVKPSALA